MNRDLSKLSPADQAAIRRRALADPEREDAYDARRKMRGETPAKEKAAAAAKWEAWETQRSLAKNAVAAERNAAALTAAAQKRAEDEAVADTSIEARADRLLRDLEAMGGPDELGNPPSRERLQRLARVRAKLEVKVG